jgi:hypothetical protein
LSAAKVLVDDKAVASETNKRRPARAGFIRLVQGGELWEM